MEGAVGHLQGSPTQKPGQLWLFSRINGREVKWLVDTGAVLTLISYSTWAALGTGQPLQNATRKVVGAAGDVITLQDQCELEITIDCIKICD